MQSYCLTFCLFVTSQLFNASFSKYVMHGVRTHSVICFACLFLYSRLSNFFSYPAAVTVTGNRAAKSTIQKVPKMAHFENN
jgi:hypothetical protein